MTLLAYLVLFIAVQVAIPLVTLPFILIEKSAPRVPKLAIGIGSVAAGMFLGGFVADAATVLAGWMATPTTAMLLLPLAPISLFALNMFSNAISRDGVASGVSVLAACVGYAIAVMA